MSAEDVENLARTIRDSRSMMRTEPMTDAEWENVKTMFPGSYRVLLAEAARMIESGEIDE